MKNTQRKHEILKSAEELFYSKGYSKTTINDILKDVGIAKGTFYYYFSSKEDVMNEIINYYVKIEIERINGIVKDNTITSTEKLIKVILNPRQSKEKAIEILHQNENALMHQKSMTETIKNVAPIIADIVVEGIETSEFNTEYPLEVVESLLVVSLTIFDEGVFNFTQEELMKRLLAFGNTADKLLGSKEGTISESIIKSIGGV